ncbi:MAG TPA: peptidylprolyl isomerase [Bacteroidales bacterium]|nr:peptidylprolyl isomerase [Bacteroidales bacterium]
MAVLEKIRTKMGILVSVIIGFSLLAFVLSDFLGGGKSVFSNNQFDIAEIWGKKVTIQEYEAQVEKLQDVYKMNTRQENIDEKVIDQIREQTWQQVLEDNLLAPEYQSIGLAVSSKELLDMVQGAEPHPYIRQIFSDPETGIFNRPAVLQFIKSLETEPDQQKKNYWLFMENQIVRERLMTKYYNLMKKGLYVTKVQVANEIKDNQRKVSFNFVGVRYNTIADSTIKVKMSDLKNYLKKHEALFQQEASRDIEYITYDIVPSADDFKATKEWIESIYNEFATTEDIKQIVSLNSDIPFNEKYLKQEEMPDTLKSLYSKGKGAVYGPYFANNAFYLARITDVKNISDSVKASHILIRPAANTQEAVKAAKATADSLLAVLKKGGNFEELASKYSSDGSAQKGGDLGWFKEGQMVKPFNDACFNGKKGDLTVVETQFGYHVIKITDKGKEVKKVQLALIERKVEASQATEQAIYQKAASFAGNNNTSEKFIQALKKDNIVPRTANYMNENMKEVPGIANSRELVRWAFKAKQNDLSGVMEFGDKYVIARLSAVREKGIASVEQIKDQLTMMVRKEKKAEQLIQKIKQQLKSSSNINDLAGKLGVNVENANDVTFASYALPTIGFEPAVIAAATTVPLNKLSDPVNGNNGVYVVEPTSETVAEVSEENVKSRIYSMYQNAVGYEAVNTLKKMAGIKDMRAKFF